MAWQTNGIGSTDATYAREVRGGDTASAFMARVYRWMVAGLALTGVTAFLVAANETLFRSLLPWMRPLMLVELGVVLAFSFLARRVSGVVAALMFLAYAFLNGVTFSVLFYAFQLGSLATVFFITAGTFAALSLYGTVTKRDLGAWGTFLFMGLVGILLAGLVNLFVQSSMLGFVVSCASVVVFAGLTAWDTQKLRALHAYAGPGEGSLAISGALTLYLDFINLFLSLLQLLGRRR